jgi:hypothetical protein
VKLILDEDLSPAIALRLRRLGIDALSVHNTDRRGLSDREQLTRAASEGRCLVTRNRNDFILLTREFFERGAAHMGVLVVPWTLAPDQPNLIAGRIARYVRRHGPGATEFLFDFV